MALNYFFILNKSQRNETNNVSEALIGAGRAVSSSAEVTGPAWDGAEGPS